MKGLAIINLVIWVIIGIVNTKIAITHIRNKTDDVEEYKKYSKYWIATYTVSYIMIILFLIQGVYKVYGL